MKNPNNNNLWYNKRLRRFAHENRTDMTKAEACLAMGFTILRFDDEDVLTGINGVYYQVEDFIKEFELKRI